MGDAVKNAGSGGLFSGDGFAGMMQVFGGNMLSKGVSMLTSELTGSVQQSLELARQGEGVRIAFERLGQPGLLDKLKEATHGTVSEMELMKQAIQFENFKLPLEDLAAYLAFAQQKAKDTGQSVDFLVTSIVTGLGRQSKQILDNLGISASELTKRMNEGADMTKAVADIIREEMAKAGDYVETAADRAARATADATNEMEKLGQQAMPVAEEFTSSFNEIKIAGMELINLVLTPLANSARSIKKILSGDFNFKEGIPNLADGGKSPWGGWKPGTDNTVKAAGGYVEITDSNTGAIIGGSHFDNLNDANSINAWKKSLFKSSSGRGSKNNIPTLADFDKALGKSLKNSDMLKESKEMLSPFAMLTDEAKKQMLGLADATEDLGGAMAALGEKNVVEEMQKMAKQGMSVKESWELAASAVSLVGQALSGIQDPAAQIMATIAMAIANVAAAYADTMLKDEPSKSNIYAFIAAAAAATVSMVSTIASIHQATGYARGGVIKAANGAAIPGTFTVPGTTYSNDQIPAMLNAGETVLTRAQAGNIASQLQGAGGSINLNGVLTGENIFLSADRYARRSGRGELVTFHR
jgi:hypothetical protein